MSLADRFAKAFKEAFQPKDEGGASSSSSPSRENTSERLDTSSSTTAAAAAAAADANSSAGAPESSTSGDVPPLVTPRRNNSDTFALLKARMSAFFASDKPAEGETSAKEQQAKALSASPSFAAQLDHCEASIGASESLLVKLVAHHVARTDRHALLTASAVVQHRTTSTFELESRIRGFFTSFGGGHVAPQEAMSRVLTSTIHPEYVLEQLRVAFKVNVGGGTDMTTQRWTLTEERSWRPLVNALLPRDRQLVEPSTTTVNTKGHVGGGELAARPTVEAEVQFFAYHGVRAAIDHEALQVYYAQDDEVRRARLPGPAEVESAFVFRLLHTGLTRERRGGSGGEDEDEGDEDDVSNCSSMSTSVCDRSVCSAQDGDLSI